MLSGAVHPKVSTTDRNKACLWERVTLTLHSLSFLAEFCGNIRFHIFLMDHSTDSVLGCGIVKMCYAVVLLLLLPVCLVVRKKSNYRCHAIE